MAKRSQKPIINKDLAENARQMVEFGFWKYLDRFMCDLVNEADERADAVTIKQAMDGHLFCEARAIRQAIKRVREEVAQHIQ